MSGTTARQYSTRLGVITDEQFQSALDRFDLDGLVRAEPIPFGNFGQNVFLTSTKGEYVLRGSPHYPWQFPKEKLFTDLLHARTSVPVPWPYLLDESDGIFGWSYVIMPRMPGLQLSDPEVQRRLSAADRRDIARAMGSTLAHLHTLTWRDRGEYDFASRGIRPFGMSHAEYVASRIRHFLNLGIAISDRTTSSDVTWVEQVIARAHAALEVPFEPCFVMEDYKEGNLVAERSGSDWHISGVFDYMEACFADGEADLSRQVAIYIDEDVELARVFASAYGERAAALDRPLRPGFAERFAVYMLLDRVIIWQFGQRHGVWWDPQLTLQEWAGPYTALRFE